MHGISEKKQERKKKKIQENRLRKNENKRAVYKTCTMSHCIVILPVEHQKNKPFLILPSKMFLRLYQVLILKDIEA